MRAAVTACLLSISLALAFSVSGCADDGSDRESPAVAIEALQAAFETRDLASICERMSAQARKDVGSVAHWTPSLCRPDLRRAFDLIERGGQWGSAPTVGRVDTNGDRASVVLEKRNGWHAAVPLKWEDDVWKLNAFFGGGQTALSASRKAPPGGGFPDVAGKRTVEATDGNGNRCPALSRARSLRGHPNCSFTVSSQSVVPLRMLTPFGDFKFGDCSLDYRLMVDGEGRTWTDEWFVDGSSVTGCADVDECFDLYNRPWPGRLVPDGRNSFTHHVAMCSNTCIGVFAGEVVTRFVRDGKAWRVEPTDGGATGFKFDGPLIAKASGLQVEPR
jgi:hypothetical protein